MEVVSRPIRTPFDFAPVYEQLRALAYAPAMMRPPQPQGPPTDLAYLRELLTAAADLLEGYQPAYSITAPVDAFLAESAATGAIFRLRAISELLNEGVCGLVAASMARSLLEDAATWAWVAEDSVRNGAVGDYFAAEWGRLVRTAARAGTPESALERWLAPSAWSGATAPATTPVAFPGTGAVVRRLAEHSQSTPDPATPLRLPGIGTMAALLATCGHFNRYAALFCPFNWDPTAVAADEGALGGRVIPEMEALVIHVALAATFTICVVTAWADLDPAADARHTLGAVADVMDAIDALASRIHHFGGVGSLGSVAPAVMPGHKTTTTRRTAKQVREPTRRWIPPDGSEMTLVRRRACEFFDIATLDGPTMVPMPPVSRFRYVTLPLLASAMWASRTLAHDVNTTSVATHAARQLLEEGAKWRWVSAGATLDERVSRTKALLGQLANWRDEFVARASHDGVVAAIHPFLKPSGFDIDDLLLNVDRTALPPTLEEALAAASIESSGLGGPWVRIAYSLLSQVTHHTPIGALHAMEVDGTTMRSGSISPQLEALTIDAGCLGASWLWIALGVLQFGAPMRSGEEFDPSAYAEWVPKVRKAAAAVHAAALPFHGLLSGSDLRQLGRNDRCRCGSGTKAKYCHLK